MTAAYFSDVVKMYRDGFRLEPDTAFLSKSEILCNTSNDDINDALVAEGGWRALETFKDPENPGTDLTYRVVCNKITQNNIIF